VILAQEISTLYNAITGSAPSLMLGELPAQYSDFARRQREFLRSDAARRQLETWRKHFAETPTLFDRSRDLGPLPLLSMHMLLVPGPLVEVLQQYAKSQGVSLFVLLLAAYKIVLAQWTRERDITTSMLLDGRRHIELKNVIGCFASMQWVRTELAADLNIPDTIQRVRQTFWRSYGTQSALVEWQGALAQGKQGPGRGFEVSINFHNSLQWHWRLAGITATRYTDYGRPGIKLDWDLLWLDLDHQPEGIYAFILYGKHRFSAARIETFAADYVELLERIAKER
jgi:hypothetical protein